LIIIIFYIYHQSIWWIWLVANSSPITPPPKPKLQDLHIVTAVKPTRITNRAHLMFGRNCQWTMRLLALPTRTYMVCENANATVVTKRDLSAASIV